MTLYPLTRKSLLSTHTATGSNARCWGTMVGKHRHGTCRLGSESLGGWHRVTMLINEQLLPTRQPHGGTACGLWDGPKLEVRERSV